MTIFLIILGIYLWTGFIVLLTSHIVEYAQGVDMIKETTFTKIVGAILILTFWPGVLFMLVKVRWL